MEKNTEELTAEEKQAKLKEIVKKASDTLNEACKYATEHKLSFSWRPFYGGGGYFEGDIDERDSYNDTGWFASSRGC